MFFQFFEMRIADARRMRACRIAELERGAFGRRELRIAAEIRQRMDSGSFQIDFNEVASNILREAIAGTQTARR